jgi:hypothetical protein
VSQARVIDAADAAVALIKAAWADRVAPSDVRRAYLNQRINLTGEDAGELLRGRQVYVFPFPPVSAADDPGDLWRTYLLRVLVVERYADAGDPPDDWVDERVAFVEQTGVRPAREPGPQAGRADDPRPRAGGHDRRAVPGGPAAST